MAYFRRVCSVSSSSAAMSFKHICSVSSSCSSAMARSFCSRVTVQTSLSAEEAQKILSEIEKMRSSSDLDTMMSVGSTWTQCLKKKISSSTSVLDKLDASMEARAANKIASSVPQLSYSSNYDCEPWLKEYRIEDDELEAIRKMASKYYPSALPFSIENICTREETDQLFRLAKTVPESASDLSKEYAKFVAYELQHNTLLGFEEKLLIMVDKVEEISMGYK